MRLAVPIVALLLCVGVAGWLLQRNTPPPPPDLTPVPQAQRTDAPVTAEQGQRVAVPNEPAAGATSPPADAGTVPQPAATPQPDRFLLIVVDATTQRPIDAFRALFRLPGGHQEVWSKNGPREVELPAGTRCELLVEALGYEPSHDAAFVVPARGDTQPEVRVALTRAAAAAGITLHVHDEARRPIEAVRVEAFALDATTREDAWTDGKMLWSRRTTAQDGRYVLPTLAAGEYGIRVFAVDETGAILPLRPYRNTFVLTGSNGFVEDVTLEAGAIPEVELVDSFGKPLVPGQVAIGLSLQLPGGAAVARQWLVRQDGELFRGADCLPGVGAAWPEEPVAPGTWQLRVLRQGLPDHVETLTLSAGERRRVRVVVP